MNMSTFPLLPIWLFGSALVLGIIELAALSRSRQADRELVRRDVDTPTTVTSGPARP